MGRKQVGLAIKDNVEPTIAAQPSEQPLNHPPDADRQEASVRACAGRDRNVDVMLERCLRKRCALEAAVAQQIALEAQPGQPRQHRQDTGTVIDVGRRQFQIEQRAMFVADRMQLDALDWC